VRAPVRYHDRVACLSLRLSQHAFRLWFLESQGHLALSVGQGGTLLCC
jgi:hypothetical protein